MLLGKWLSMPIHSCHDTQFTVGDFVWLSLEHLSLPSLLTCKLVAKFVMPYKIT